MGKNDVSIDFLTNARQLRGELFQVNAHLHNINESLTRMNTKGAAGARAHGSAIKGLAMRFVGYNLILNQVMGAQQKVYEYVKESITKFREFETRIAEVSTIMGADFQEAIYGLQAGVETLSLSFGKNTSDMSKGLYDIMSAAFDAEESIALLGSSTKAAIAGLADVRESVDIFTTVLNTYGMSAYEATWVSDALFQSVVRGKFQFKDLESALGYVVPIAAQAGIAFDELMAALSTTTRHGLHLDMASRGLAMTIQNIINPSEEAKKAAQKYGVEMNGLALRVKGLTGFFTDLNDKTKESGKIVLNELIPNIRSLRVAMVLAGDEGLDGLIDDMDRLSIAAGRTEEALGKIMDTSEFVSNQIAQKWEQTQREVGESWDKMALGLQGALVDIVKNIPSFIPVIGPVFTALGADQERQYQSWLKRVKIHTGVQEGYTKKDDPREVMQTYLELQEAIADQSRRVSDLMVSGQDYSVPYRQLLDLQEISTDLQEDFNRAFGEPILSGIRNLEELQLTLDEIEFSVAELEKSLTKEVSYGWGKYAGSIAGTLNYQYKMLEAEQTSVDVQHDIKMGLDDASYGYKVLGAEMQEAIKIVREYEKAQKAASSATSAHNQEMRKLQLQAAQIQLKGMLRRRGLTRQEERQLKRIQIAQLKLRIDDMKNELAAETIAENALYLAKKEMIENYQLHVKEITYQLKYSYDQQLEDLRAQIDGEYEALQQRKIWWQDTSDEIELLSEELMTSLEEIFSDTRLTALFSNFGINISELLQQARGVTQSLGDDTINSYSRGIKYVPETQIALVHAGESIAPAGMEQGGKVEIHNHISAVINSDIDIETLAAKLTEGERRSLLKNGRSNYKLRFE